MSNPRENPNAENQSQGDEIKKAFKEVFNFKETHKKAFMENSFRLDALEAGMPIKKHDTQKESFIKSEIVNYAKAISGKSYNEFAKDFENYKMPEFSQLVKKDQQTGKLLSNADSIEKYKWATAFAPLAKGGVRDFRQAKKFEIQKSQSGRIAFNTDLQLEHEKASYDPEKLFLSMLAESEDGDKEFTIQPYAHIDKENKIVSKSLLVLNSEQRKMAREFMAENIKDNV